MMVMTTTGSAMPTLALFFLLSTQSTPNGVTLAEAARQQIGVTTLYDPSYQRLKYPGGDVPLDRGVCTDVIIRAYRKQGIDLQVLVHQDLLQAPKAYQRGSTPIRPDPNIDHRRVPNLATFFQRHGAALPITADYHPGDLVIWRLDSGLPHIGCSRAAKAAREHSFRWRPASS